MVDDLIDRVMIDARLNTNPQVDEAHHRVSPAGFKYFVIEMVCWASGGPQKYSGRSMGDSHRHLMITDQEWEAFMDDFQQTLDRFEVPQQEQQELKAIVKAQRNPSWSDRFRKDQPRKQISKTIVFRSVRLSSYRP